MRRVAPFFVLAAVLAAVALPAGQAQDRGLQPEPQHRFTLLSLRGEGPRIFDRATGRLYLVDLRDGPERGVVSCLDATQGTLIGRPLKYDRFDAPEGVATWPARDAQGQPPPRFVVSEAGRSLIVFDGQTGCLHVLEDMEKTITIDPVAATAVERPVAMNDLEGALSRRRADANEAAAIGALKTISTAQTLFREGDKEGDGELDYARDLKELADAQLIDAALGSGTKQGYVFETAASPTTPAFLWMATARPERPGTTGARYFAINHAGVVYHRADAPFEITPECDMPPGARPVGR